jgi:hypothetical protein
MRASNIILSLVVGVILFCAFVFFALPLFSSPYLRFMARDAAYYSEIVHACDTVLQQHPVGSNDTVTLYGHTMPYTIKLSAGDASLPKAIRALNPDMILVSTNRVFIEIPPERMGGFTVFWEPDEMRSNYWALQSDGDGLVKTVYEEWRP